MPELPEVEVVRRGLAGHVGGRVIARCEVLHPRAVRRSTIDLPTALAGRRIDCVSRRGKYLWLPLDGHSLALVAHLGMSGQLLLQPPARPDETHLRARIAFATGRRELRFVDQRTFGGLSVHPMVDDGAGGRIPDTVAHIARDPLDPLFDDQEFVRRVRSRSSGVKRILLDQTVASGIGNIYADEALWRVGVHGERPGRHLAAGQVRDLLGATRAVMADALAAGGTSFDALYVNVNGQNGYFDRSLDAYGQEGEPCARCGTAIRRSAFMNRSSYWCPSCQPAPRARAAGSRSRG
jgi:formamidopyrimidine-DNA glycosylase